MPNNPNLSAIVAIEWHSHALHPGIPLALRDVEAARQRSRVLTNIVLQPSPRMQYLRNCQISEVKRRPDSQAPSCQRRTESLQMRNDVPEHTSPQRLLRQLLRHTLRDKPTFRRLLERASKLRSPASSISSHDRAREREATGRNWLHEPTTARCHWPWRLGRHNHAPELEATEIAEFRQWGRLLVCGDGASGRLCNFERKIRLAVKNPDVMMTRPNAYCQSAEPFHPSLHCGDSGGDSAWWAAQTPLNVHVERVSFGEQRIYQCQFGTAVLLSINKRCRCGSPRNVQQFKTSVQVAVGWDPPASTSSDQPNCEERKIQTLQLNINIDAFNMASNARSVNRLVLCSDLQPCSIRRTWHPTRRLFGIFISPTARTRVRAGGALDNPARSRYRYPALLAERENGPWLCIIPGSQLDPSQRSIAHQSSITGTSPVNAAVYVHFDHVPRSWPEASNGLVQHMVLPTRGSDSGQTSELRTSESEYRGQSCIAQYRTRTRETASTF
ncbi:hypothetical protein C8F01DRAFT_1080601 [Mycena amicta]|nr:hypothetical protein C8F01DRAFT_1080601 [Mycena amicta]